MQHAGGSTHQRLINAPEQPVRIPVLVVVLVHKVEYRANNLKHPVCDELSCFRASYLSTKINRHLQGNRLQRMDKANGRPYSTMAKCV